MRLFEAVQFALVVAVLVIPVVFGRRLRRGRMAVALIIAMVVQLLVEGFRWQLLPLEVGTVLLAAGDALWEDRRFRGLRRFRRGALGVFGLVAVSVLPITFPVPQLPEPTGPFAVGTVTVTLTDIEREEVYGLPEPEAETDPAPEGEVAEAEPGAPRELVVEVWYPADVPDDAEPIGWTPAFEAIQPEVAGALGVPALALGHLRGVPSHSYADAPILDGQFPVVVGSHDWLGIRTDSLDQVEALASHGFIVVVPDHTYVAAAVRFPDDDSVAAADLRALPQAEATEDPEAYLQAAQDLAEYLTDDLSFILDQLSAPAPQLTQLAIHMDLDNVGVYGRGLGGAVASRLCLTDDRCHALLAMDPWVEAIPDRTVARELQIPALVIRSEETWGSPNDRRLRGMAERSPELTYWMGIAGTRDADFTLAPLLSPFSDRFGWSGSIDPERTSQIVDSYLVAFFERFLLGVGGSDLDQPPPEEVDLELVR